MMQIVMAITLAFTSGVIFGILICALMSASHVQPPTPPASDKTPPRIPQQRIRPCGQGGVAA